jgi:hypothetical protein
LVFAIRQLAAQNLRNDLAKARSEFICPCRRLTRMPARGRDSLARHAAKRRRRGGKSRQGIAVFLPKPFPLKHISSMRKNMSGLRQRCGEPRQNLWHAWETH